MLETSVHAEVGQARCEARRLRGQMESRQWPKDALARRRAQG